MTLPAELPLFPLNVVLFPGMPLPLHIFEERYKLMINRCIRTHTPFGVVLTREAPSGEPTVPYRVGTTALITNVERLGQGRLNITTVGCERFVVEAFTQTTPYLKARVAPFPLDAAPEAPALDTLALRRLFERYVTSLARLVQEDYSFEQLPEDALTLACLTAIILQISALEKQRLLETAALTDLFAREHTLLRREICLVDFMFHSAPPTEQVEAFSRN